MTDREIMEKELSLGTRVVEDDLYSAPTGPYRPPQILYRGHKEQLHHNADNATYLFVARGEVVSIHFDRKRGQIFYQGHNIENIALTPSIQQHLIAFADQLVANRHAMGIHYSDYCKHLEAVMEARNRT